MLIILKRDEWDGLTVVKNHLDKPKMFKDWDEAWDFGIDFELCPFQIIEVNI